MESPQGTLPASLFAAKFVADGSGISALALPVVERKRQNSQPEQAQRRESSWGLCVIYGIR